jgi:hypothetical protein
VLQVCEFADFSGTCGEAATTLPVLAVVWFARNRVLGMNRVVHGSVIVLHEYRAMYW